MMLQCLFIDGLQCTGHNARCQAWSSEQDWQDLFSWGLSLILLNSEGNNFWMNYNFNVLIMLCDKISIVVFERNSPVLLKSDHLPESTASSHTMPGLGCYPGWGWSGWKALARDLQWKVLVKEFPEHWCVCDRKSQVKAIYLNRNIRMKGTCDPEKILFAAFY